MSGGLHVRQVILLVIQHQLVLLVNILHTVPVGVHLDLDAPHPVTAIGDGDNPCVDSVTGVIMGVVMAGVGARARCPRRPLAAVVF